jgi:type II secretory pathway pseudopilin PulG
MTLLESLVALVILGVSAVGFLGVFQASSRSVRSAEEWNRAVAVAEAALEEQLASLKAGAPPLRSEPPSGFTSQIASGSWRPGVTELAVTVTMPGGASFTVHRLVRSR